MINVGNRPWQKLYDFNVPASIRYPRVPVQNLFHLTAATFPNKAALNMGGSELTFWQLREQMLRLANALGKMGVGKGDRVGLHLPNCPQFVIAYLAALSAGAVVVNMNPLYTHEELKFIMENTVMKALVTSDATLGVIRPLTKEIGLKSVIVTRVTDYMDGKGKSMARSLDLEKGWAHFSETIEECSEMGLPKILFAPRDPAMIQFTGGTTGLPKGAVLTHANVVAAVFQASQWANPILERISYPQRNVMGIIPYFHVYGSICSMNCGLYSASTQYLMPRFDLEELMGLIAKLDHITFFPAVPTMITAIVNHPQADGLNLGKKIGVLNSGGAPMPAELIDRVKDMGIFFCEGWGMSETTATGTSNPFMANKAGSIGVPVPDNDIRLVDVDKGVEDVKPGEPGEILIKGPAVMQGYWNNPVETENQLKDGWLSTGDIAVADEDGYLYIVDRKKDMIIAGGFNIYPREVDEVLYRHPKVSEAITVGIPDAYRGETLKAYVVLKPGEAATDKEIIAFCREKLTAYKVPKLVEFRTELPKSTVGKILRKMLREEEAAKRQV
jgi:long-chain acyl-CoA synthetase